jgi:hypothetical protein
MSEVRMMPMVHDTFDVRFQSDPEPAEGLAIAAREHRQRHEMLEEIRHLAAENARLADENRALREAAGLWIGLYEKQLERANRAMSVVARTEPARE